MNRKEKSELLDIYASVLVLAHDAITPLEAAQHKGYIAGLRRALRALGIEESAIEASVIEWRALLNGTPDARPAFEAAREAGRAGYGLDRPLRPYFNQGMMAFVRGVHENPYRALSRPKAAAWARGYVYARRMMGGA